MTVSNMGSTADVAFRRYDAVSARQIRDVVEAVYVGLYVDAIASGDPFTHQGHFLRGSGIPVDQLAAMAIEFLTTAELPECVQWRDLTDTADKRAAP